MVEIVYLCTKTNQMHNELLDAVKQDMLSVDLMKKDAKIDDLIEQFEYLRSVYQHKLQKLRDEFEPSFKLLLDEIESAN